MCRYSKSLAWETHDAQLILYSYSTAHSLLPIFNRALSYLHRIGTEASDLDVTDLANACLSASYFVSAAWKRLVLDVAERAVEHQLARFCNPASSSSLASLDGANRQGHGDISHFSLLRARIRLRKHQLARLFPDHRDTPAVTDFWKQCVPPASPYFGFLLLSQAQDQIDSLAGATTIGNIVQKLWMPNPSRLQQHIILEGQFLYAKSLRFEGRFDEATVCFDRLLSACSELGHSSKRMVSQMSAVHCETGETAKSIATLNTEYLTLARFQSMDTGDGRRLTLALANCYLMKGLWPLIQRGKADDASLALSEELFQQVQSSKDMPSLVDRFREFTALAGVAMAHTAMGKFDLGFQNWQASLEASRRCWSKAGHSEMVALYGSSETAYKLGYDNTARDLAAQAEAIHRTVGRQYYFVGHGTLFLDILGDMARSQGRNRLVARRVLPPLLTP